MVTFLLSLAFAPTVHAGWGNWGLMHNPEPTAASEPTCLDVLEWCQDPHNFMTEKCPHDISAPNFDPATCQSLNNEIGQSDCIVRAFRSPSSSQDPCSTVQLPFGEYDDKTLNVLETLVACENFSFARALCVRKFSKLNPNQADLDRAFNCIFGAARQPEFKADEDAQKCLEFAGHYDLDGTANYEKPASKSGRAAGLVASSLVLASATAHDFDMDECLQRYSEDECDAMEAYDNAMEELEECVREHNDEAYCEGKLCMEEYNDADFCSGYYDPSESDYKNQVFLAATNDDFDMDGCLKEYSQSECDDFEAYANGTLGWQECMEEYEDEDYCGNYYDPNGWGDNQIFLTVHDEPTARPTLSGETIDEPTLRLTSDGCSEFKLRRLCNQAPYCVWKREGGRKLCSKQEVHDEPTAGFTLSGETIDEPTARPTLSGESSGTETENVLLGGTGMTAIATSQKLPFDRDGDKCRCAGGSISIWSTYETFPKPNPKFKVCPERFSNKHCAASSSHGCDDKVCSWIAHKTDVKDISQCAAACRSTSRCAYYTYSYSRDSCVMYDACPAGMSDPRNGKTTTRPVDCPDAVCVGGCDDGSPYTMHDYMTSVRELRVWWGHGSSDRIDGLEVVFFNGKQQSQGETKGKPNSSFTFDAGEFLKGQVTLGANHQGSRAGYIHFKTNTDREFSAGTLRGEPYYFEATGSLLSGFYGRADDEIHQLGLLLFKPIKSLKITDVTYPTLDSYLAGLNPTSIVDRPYCNDGANDENEERSVTHTTGSKEVWSFSMTESFEMTVNIEVTAGVPEVEEVKESTQYKWGISSTQSYSREQDDMESVQETLKITYPKHSKGDIRFTQFDSKINVPWTGYELVTFKDGSSMKMGVSGTYEGVHVSELKSTYDVKPCNPCYCSVMDDVTNLAAKKGKNVAAPRQSRIPKEFVNMFSEALSPDVEGN